MKNVIYKYYEVKLKIKDPYANMDLLMITNFLESLGLVLTCKSKDMIICGRCELAFISNYTFKVFKQ
jgi:hypothetical protein